MAAPSPDSERILADIFEEKINTQLRAKFDGEQHNSIVPRLSERVVEYLRGRYDSRGWNFAYS